MIPDDQITITETEDGRFVATTHVDVLGVPVAYYTRGRTEEQARVGLRYFVGNRVKCSELRRLSGQPYPRTCAECGLFGKCRYTKNPVPNTQAYINAMEDRIERPPPACPKCKDPRVNPNYQPERWRCFACKHEWPIEV